MVHPKREISQSKQLAINMAANFASYGVSLLISFFLSPYIVRTIGVEANGFVGLANNFVSYAGLITIALNSLAGRFITISLTRGDLESAKKYFTSVFYANMAIAAFLLIVGSGIIIFLDRLINIPAALLSDVRWLFIFVFLNCILSVAGSVFSVAVFARNKLYLTTVHDIEGCVARALCILGLFVFSTPKVCYIGFSSLLVGCYSLYWNIHYTRQLLPEIQIDRKNYDFRAIRELVASGIWNTINRMGQILIDGLDLLITNLFVDATSMGVLGLSKTVPNLISGLMGSIVGVFSPNYTILYAQGKHDELLIQIKQSMKIMGFLTNTPVIVLLTCGQDFFSNWQPTQDPEKLHLLSVLTIGCLIFSGGINCLYGIFTVVNKMKANSLVVLGCGALSTLIVLLLVNVTDLGVYAVAGVSTVVSIIRNLAFTAPYGAKCLNQKWYIFYPEIFKPVFFVILSVLCCTAVLPVIHVTGWLGFFVKAAVSGMMSLAVGFWIVLNKNDRRFLLSKIIRR